MLPLSSNTLTFAMKEEDSQQELSASSLVSRNVTIASHRTSIRLEPDMWDGLREISRREHLSIHEIATAVSGRKPANSSLTAAIRVFVMAYFRATATEEGHSRAGHGPGGSFIASLVTESLSNNATSMSGMTAPSPYARSNGTRGER
jgi:predicted DNA-binding ribbon-helix-helix protein